MIPRQPERLQMARSGILMSAEEGGIEISDNEIALTKLAHCAG